MQTPQNKPKKYPPRALAKMATMDGDIPKEKLERNKNYRSALELGAQNKWGWETAKKNIPNLESITSARSWVRHRRMCQEAGNSAEHLNFTVGRIADVSNKALLEFAKESIKRNGEGDEIGYFEGVEKLHGMSKKRHLSNKALASAQRRLYSRHKVGVRIPNTSTAAQHREDLDIRNPYNHACGYIAMTTDVDNNPIPPMLRFCIDLTGEGILLQPGNNKVFHPTQSTRPAARTSRGSNMKTNMKLVYNMMDTPLIAVLFRVHCYVLITSALRLHSTQQTE